MGLLDQVIGGMLGPQGRGGNSGIGNVLTELLAPRQQQSSDTRDRLNSQTGSQTQGGLEGLLESFTRAGHGEVADSWVGTGQNRPLTPRQLEQALDRDRIDDLARRSGLSREELLQQLSEHLPNAVDRLTPQGRRPNSEDMGHW